jgi:ubiquinone/menaquinone biosynthesis C-methylase UbiE
MERFASTIPEGSQVLEIGSGPSRGGYSAEAFFNHCEFTATDVNPQFDRTVVDVTNIPFQAGSFDVVLATNVLEHVWDYSRALEEIHRVLKPGGTVFVMVPFLFPLHDEPHDYWRFTRHALTRLLGGFDDVTITYAGTAKLPMSYRVTARRHGSRSDSIDTESIAQD